LAFKNWKSEYTSTLKGTEVEEILDLLIYRPISFLFVKLIYPTSITPNQISVVALLMGIFAGICYAFGSNEFYTLAAIFFFLCNTLDCVDGQLARLKKNGTKVGRVVDGFIDYVTSASTFVGIAIALSSSSIVLANINDTPFGPLIKITENTSMVLAWLLTAVAAASRIIQNMLFDYNRNMYQKYVYNKVSDLNEEIAEYTEEQERLAKFEGKRIEKFLVNIYLKYCKVQKKVTHYEHLNVTPEEYKRLNKALLRMWSWLGSTTHITLAIIFTFLYRVDIYLYLVIIVGNLLCLLLFVIQKSIILYLKYKK
jgi:hypothetical protein